MVLDFELEHFANEMVDFAVSPGQVTLRSPVGFAIWNPTGRDHLAVLQHTSVPDESPRWVKDPIDWLAISFRQRHEGREMNGYEASIAERLIIELWRQSMQEDAA